ncbi:MAG: hypothetical protein J2P57_12585 [Acidimicrobiaceae bacterium]|nr:hypothetical protein [Acidimicrobiaceae bacterium]
MGLGLVIGETWATLTQGQRFWFDMIGEAGIAVLVVVMLVRAHRAKRWILGPIAVMPWLFVTIYRLVDWQSYREFLGWVAFLPIVLFIVIGYVINLFGLPSQDTAEGA